MVRVTFLHPDLGIGGAERLIVDAALALQKNGHEVNLVTTHHDPSRCFAETKDGTLAVTVVGDWLPRHIFGRFFALCAYTRMIYAAICIFFMKLHPDVVICDLVSMCIPFLWLSTKNVIFYCHHPDQLLTAPGGWLKQLYRTPLNYLEEFTTGLATKIFVNSIYTLQVFKNTFKRLNVEPEILYPSLHTDFIDSIEIVLLNQVLDTTLPNDCTVLLSINRYERKKHLLLALETFSELKRFVGVDEYRKMYLIMAGGYDKRVLENVEYYSELVQHAKDLEIEKQVIFLRSPTDCEKMSLLTHCSLLIYTPPNEHFGIVPVEAMYFAKPVLAHNSGGPRETVVDGETGYLVAELSAHAFAEKAAILVKNKNLRVQFGDRGKKRVEKTFSFSVFSQKLNNSVISLM